MIGETAETIHICNAGVEHEPHDVVVTFSFVCTGFLLMLGGTECGRDDQHEAHRMMTNITMTCDGKP